MHFPCRITKEAIDGNAQSCKCNVDEAIAQCVIGVWLLTNETKKLVLRKVHTEKRIPSSIMKFNKSATRKIILKSSACKIFSNNDVSRVSKDCNSLNSWHSHSPWWHFKQWAFMHWRFKGNIWRFCHQAKRNWKLKQKQNQSDLIKWSFFLFPFQWNQQFLLLPRNETSISFMSTCCLLVALFTSIVVLWIILNNSLSLLFADAERKRIVMIEIIAVCFPCGSRGFRLDSTWVCSRRVSTNVKSLRITVKGCEKGFRFVI